MNCEQCENRGLCDHCLDYCLYQAEELEEPRIELPRPYGSESADYDR